tara:strand:+ start:457 stop:735 length:279 start_codon:yes stop_codon:yes gene_type:complete
MGKRGEGNLSSFFLSGLFLQAQWDLDFFIKIIRTWNFTSDLVCEKIFTSLKDCASFLNLRFKRGFSHSATLPHRHKNTPLKGLERACFKQAI